MSRRVVIEGRRFGTTPGVHVFVNGSPRRLVCIVRDFRCERCAATSPIWMTDDWRWRLVPRRWHRKMLCVPCYRQLRKDPPG